MTEKLQEAAQQVRELAKRVEQDSEEVLGDDGMVMVVPLDAYNDMMEAITALREALVDPDIEETTLTQIAARHEQAEQEPCIECGRPTMSAESKCNDCHSMDDTAPQPISQEPVAWHHPKCDGQCIACLIEKAVEDAYGTQGRDYMLRHINAAPIRTKDLTDDEAAAIAYKGFDDYWTEDCKGIQEEAWLASARAVITAHKEKQNANNNA